LAGRFGTEGSGFFFCSEEEYAETLCGRRREADGGKWGIETDKGDSVLGGGWAAAEAPDRSNEAARAEEGVESKELTLGSGMEEEWTARG
jgi:hypothetical protein